MKLTKRQKISLGVLGAAVAAFGIDQLSGAPAAVTAEVSQLLPILASGDASAPAATPLPVGRVQLAAFDPATATALDRLKPLTIGPVRDAFLPASSWFSAASSVVTDSSAADFAKAHPLKAVFCQGGGKSQALLDNTLVRIGQSVDGFVLVSVGDRSAVFQCNGVQAQLKLNDPMLSGVEFRILRIVAVNPIK